MPWTHREACSFVVVNNQIHSLYKGLYAPAGKNVFNKHISCRLFKEWNKVIRKRGSIPGTSGVNRGITGITYNKRMQGRSAVGSKYSCNIVEGNQITFLPIAKSSPGS